MKCARKGCASAGPYFKPRIHVPVVAGPTEVDQCIGITVDLFTCGEHLDELARDAVASPTFRDRLRTMVQRVAGPKAQLKPFDYDRAFWRPHGAGAPC